MIKLRCTLPNLANVCPHDKPMKIATNFAKAIEFFYEENREVMTGGPSVVFTRKAVVGETFINIRQISAN